MQGGHIERIDCNVEYYRAPEGRQIYVRELGGERLVILHFLAGAAPLSLDFAGWRMEAAYIDLAYTFDGGVLSVPAPRDFTAGAFLLKKQA